MSYRHRLIVLLSFFDEPDLLLQEMLMSLRPLRPDLIVAVDGRYENFPDDQDVSPWSNYRTIVEAAYMIGADCYIDTAHESYKDDEVGKRKRLLEVGLQLTTSEDWFLVMDSDYLLHESDDARAYLDTGFLYEGAVVSFFEGRLPGGEPASHPARLLMRASRGLSMTGNHYTYVLPDGRGHHHILDRGSTAPAIDLQEEVLVEHRVHQRPPARREAQTRYYEVRDIGGLER